MSSIPGLNILDVYAEHNLKLTLAGIPIIPILIIHIFVLALQGMIANEDILNKINYI